MATIQFPKEAEPGEEKTGIVTTVKVWGCRGSIPRSEPACSYNLCNECWQPHHSRYHNDDD